ncbi:MAG: isocitrate lyase/phosphoenolpyruvate mutase family protein [Vampirovibrionales bacterium]|nr:isocitrate lyase/phosphoenolpyruvate mutase family protein [Vampirovibrionales bacterium]
MMLVTMSESSSQASSQNSLASLAFPMARAAGAALNLPAQLCQRLRDAQRLGPLMIPGATNALAAKQIEQAGFQSVYVSGAGLANSAAGYPDIGLLTLSEVAFLGGLIARSTNLPTIIDADTGFGEAVQVYRTVQLLEQEGLSGLHLEDQVFPKRCGHLDGKQVIRPEAMAQKLRAACAARQNPDFLIIARTDAYSLNGMADALERARLYLDAGAQMIFPEALATEAEFAEFARELYKTHPKALLLANMTEFGKSALIPAERLGAMGYQAVIYPLTLMRAVLTTQAELLAELKASGTQQPWVARMTTRKALYDLLAYPAYAAFDATLGGYFKPQGPA